MVTPRLHMLLYAIALAPKFLKEVHTKNEPNLNYCFENFTLTTSSSFWSIQWSPSMLYWIVYCSTQASFSKTPATIPLVKTPVTWWRIPRSICKYSEAELFSAHQPCCLLELRMLARHGSNPGPRKLDAVYPPFLASLRLKLKSFLQPTQNKPKVYVLIVTRLSI